MKTLSTFLLILSLGLFLAPAFSGKAFGQPAMLFNPVSIEQIILEHEVGPVLTLRGELTFNYYVPPTLPLQYLNIYYQPPGSIQAFWIAENIILEHFGGNMEMSLTFDLDPLGLNQPPSLLPFVDLCFTVSDSIFPIPLPPAPSLFDVYPIVPTVWDFGGAQTLSPGALGPFPGNPSLPPKVWQGDSTKGVLVGCNMPNIELDSIKYRSGSSSPHVPSDYAGDWNACGPAATANSFSWLRGQHPDIDTLLGTAFGYGDSAHRKILAEFSELMDRSNEGPVGIKDFIEGKLAFIDKYKLPIRVAYQSVFLVQAGDSTVNSPDGRYGHKAKNKSETPSGTQIHGRNSPEWLYEQMKKGADTELNIQWRKTDALGNVTYPNGHYVVVTGVRDNRGNWRLKWKDDKHQSGPGGIRQGITDMVVESTGVIRLPGLDNEEWGEAFIEDIVVECYDPTITFNAIAGESFEDTDGSGTQDAGEGGGVGGAVVNLIDGITGVTLQTTMTAQDGSYLFHDLGPGTFILEVLPPQGYVLSPPLIGGDPTLDSDFDPLTGLTPPLIILPLPSPLNPIGDIDMGLNPIGITRMGLELMLQGPYDQNTGLMTTDLMTQGLLPVVEPYSANGWGLTEGAGAPRSTDPGSPCGNIVDFVVVVLRDSADPSLILASRAAMLLSDGSIVGFSCEALSFSTVGHGNYFVSVHHRNSLAIMSQNVIYLNSIPVSVDFTSSAFPTFGTDSRATLPNGKMALHSGDANGSGVIDAADRSGTWNFRNAVGYLPWDINLDGVVDAADRAGTWNKRNNSEQLP